MKLSLFTCPRCISRIPVADRYHASPTSFQLFVASTLCFILSSCGDSPYSQALSIARESINPPEPSRVDAGMIDRLPYASMGARLGKGGQTLVVLATLNGSSAYWTAPDSATLRTSGYRVVRTAGLGADQNRDLAGLQLLSRDPLEMPSAELPHARLLMTMTLPGSRAYQMPVSCTYRVDPPSTLRLLERDDYRVEKITENCKAQSTLNWEFTNLWWRETESWQVRKTIQSFSPDWPALELEVFRPYANGVEH